MKLEIKNYFGEIVELVPKVALYSVKDFMGKELPGLAVLLETTDGYPYADLTVSFGEFIGLKNCAYCDASEFFSCACRSPWLHISLWQYSFITSF